MDSDIAIKADKVSKDFILPHEKKNSIKSIFTSGFKKSKKSKETQHALKNISFDIKKGEFFGIVGRNGSGKSTLLKILAGIYQPTSGSTQVNGKLVPFIELGVGFNPELTGRENIFLNGALLGFSKKEVEEMYDSIVEFAELERFIDQKLKNYSSGMGVRLAFSVAVRAKGDILLIDEVLAVGDADFQRKCYDYFHKLKKDKKTVIFVSHDMNAVREYCDRSILIEDSEMVYEGKSDKVATMYNRMFEEKEAKKMDVKSTRWGSKKVEYKDIKSTIDKDNLTIKLYAKANSDIENVIFGFRVRNSEGQALLGTNTQIEKKPTYTLKKGEKMELEWKVPNVFNDGEYIIDPAITLINGEMLDWWEDAATFISNRSNHTPYFVAPNVSIGTSRVK